MKLKSKFSLSSAATFVAIVATAMSVPANAEAGLFNHHKKKDREEVVQVKTKTKIKRKAVYRTESSSDDQSSSRDESSVSRRTADRDSSTRSRAPSIYSQYESNLSTGADQYATTNGRCAPGYRGPFNGVCYNSRDFGPGGCDDVQKPETKPEPKVVCDDPSTVLDESGKNCVPKCVGDTVYNADHDSCDPKKTETKPEPQKCGPEEKHDIAGNCVPDETKHVDSRPIRTKPWCTDHGFKFEIGKDGNGHCGGRLAKKTDSSPKKPAKKTVNKPEQKVAKKEEKKTEKKSNCTVTDPCEQAVNRKNAEIDQIKKDDAQKISVAQDQVDDLNRKLDSANQKLKDVQSGPKWKVEITQDSKDKEKGKELVETEGGARWKKRKHKSRKSAKAEADGVTSDELQALLGGSLVNRAQVKVLPSESETVSANDSTEATVGNSSTSASGN